MPAPVAVVMSVYEGDEPALFKRALVSIEQQDYCDAPVRMYLCIDGPVSREISSIVDENRIYKVVRNDANLGLARSLNRLLDSLEDEAFVFRMDSDDFSHPGRISAQIGAMQSQPVVDILGSGINEVDRSGRLLNTIRYPEEAGEIRNYIARRSPLAHPTVCFRRRAIERFRNYPEVPVNQDWALWFRCLTLGLVIANLRAPLVDMTVSDEFFRRRGPGRAWQEFRIIVGGIRATHGVTWRYVFPVLRFVFRLLPRGVVRRIYGSRLR